MSTSQSSVLHAVQDLGIAQQLGLGVGMYMCMVFACMQNCYLHVLALKALMHGDVCCNFRMLLLMMMMIFGAICCRHACV